jgi:hypothetical protein
MDREPVTRDRRVKRLILKIELEAQLVAIVCNGSVKIIDEKLRGYAVSCVARSLGAVVISFPISITRPPARRSRTGTKYLSPPAGWLTIARL